MRYILWICDACGEEERRLESKGRGRWIETAHFVFCSERHMKLWVATKEQLIEEAKQRVPHVVKRRLEIEAAGGACESDFGCSMPRAKEAQPCPYEEEVNLDEKLCHCCDACRNLCAQEV